MDSLPQSPGITTAERNYFLDYTKGVLICLVVIGHAIQFLVTPTTDLWSDPIFKLIYMFHMPLFMAISGYLAYNGLQRGSPLKYSLSKIKAYAMPIFAWTLAHQIGHNVAHRQFPTSDLFNKVLINSFGNLWFLWALLLSLIITIHIKSIKCLFWPLYVASTGLVFVLPEDGSLKLIKYIYLFFQIGYIIAHLKAANLSSQRVLHLLTLALPTFLISYYFWTKTTNVYISGMDLNQENLPNLTLRFLGASSASLVALILIHQAYQRSNSYVKQVLGSFGSKSIYIYILQGYVLLLLSRFALKVPVPYCNSALGSLIAVLIGFIITTLCFVLGSTMSKSRLLDLLFFGKSRKSTTP